MNKPLVNTPWGTNKALCLSMGICVKCGEMALRHIHTKEGLAEYCISGLCEDCFDAMFSESDKEAA